MLTRLDLRGLDGPAAAVLPRPAAAKEPPVEAVQAIMSNVRAGGDAALRALTERFDHVRVGDLRVPPEELEAAWSAAPAPLREAMVEARDAIEAFHRHQRSQLPPFDRGGITVRELVLPVGRAGLYVPGGRARYPSTVLMTAVPARVAGVASLALCVPPGGDGKVPEPTLAAAFLAGVDEVYRVGGAQAVAAMAYGTESIAPVDVIVGPGNVYVALAKAEVSGIVGVPSAFAGPSEVVVVGDSSTPPDLAAVDLVVQAEHGPDGLAWLVTWSEELAGSVDAEMGTLVERSARRAELTATLAEGGYSAVVSGPEQAMEVSNAIAPEHLELMVEDPEPLVAMVRNAGAVFTGSLSPAAVGDYLAGPSHVLPTNGSARFSSALGVADFCRRTHVVSVNRGGLERVAPHVVSLAEAEGLDAHALAVKLRQAEGT